VSYSAKRKLNFSVLPHQKIQIINVINNYIIVYNIFKLYLRFYNKWRALLKIEILMNEINGYHITRIALDSNIQLLYLPIINIINITLVLYNINLSILYNIIIDSHKYLCNTS